jgi:hypothetical protein
MDFNAGQFASDKILEEYGLKAAGQRYSLRWFCQTQSQDRSSVGGSNTESKEMRKRRLLEELRKKSKKTVTEGLSVNVDHSTNPVEKTRKIQLGWMHYNKEKEKYVAV